MPSLVTTIAGVQHANDERLARIVSLDLRHVPLDEALKAIDSQAHLGLIYSTRIVPVTKPVTVVVAHITAGEALSQVLEGTGVRAVTGTDGVVMLVAGESVRPDSTVTGTVWGRVIDSTSGKPLEGATVSIKGTNADARTSAEGYFFLRHVPPGLRTVGANDFGYRPVNRTILMDSGRRVRADFALRMLPTRLQQIVSTATGGRRLLETGNDITVINADSIVATQPVSSVTQLLEGRVPGLVVQQSSGQPGAPARLRLRGVGSIALTNDPIVIVDGVRVYSTVSSSRTGNMAQGFGVTGSPTVSPLDQIDVNSIDKVEVFKGPSATTMYGPDAAGGVIVITTKQGRNSPARWLVDVKQGMNYIPGKFAPGYIRWGHTALTNTPIACPISNVSCTPDSLVTFQTLNDPTTSPIGRGTNSQESIGVDGGVGGLTYALDAEVLGQTGDMHLPSFEANRYEALQGAAPPGWMRKPEGLTQWAGTSRLSAQLGQSGTISLTTMISRSNQQTSSLDGLLGGLQQTYLDHASGIYYRSGSDGISQSSSDFLSAYNTKIQSASTTFTTAMALDWHPRTWLTTSATAGLNYTSRQDNMLEPPGTSNSIDSAGTIGTGSAVTVVPTVNLQATTVTSHLPGDIGMSLAIGANYSATTTADNYVSGSGLPQGATSVAQAATIRGDQQSSDIGTYGIYLAPSLHKGQLWMDTGLRLDGGSSYGSVVHLVAFPKVSFSYLVSNEPWFPRAWRAVVNDLQLRFAYGIAGQVPTPTERLRLFDLSTGVVNGTPANSATMIGLGNDRLEPEKTAETDGGITTDLFDGRLAITVDGYQKVTHNAIMSAPLAPSVYGGGDVALNVGT
ncbi:MAG: TonB-dependent receptor domain-containing protein, partial [Gemmatimonadaceae bacterium]